jgi:dihydroceramidase
LTSEDAGKPLGGRFAWPVGMIVNGQAGRKLEQNGFANGGTHSNGHAKANGVVTANGGAHSNGVAKANGVVKANGNGKKTL